MPHSLVVLSTVSYGQSHESVVLASTGCGMSAVGASVSTFFEVTSFPEVDSLPDSANPYEVDVGLQQVPRPGMTFGQILGGIVFGTIAAVTAFVATCLSGLFLVTPVFRMFRSGSAEGGQAILLVVVTFASMVSAATFIKVFRGARSSQ